MTKFVITEAIQRYDDRTTAKFIFERIICVHGPFKYLLSDRGANFTSHLVKNLLNAIGAKQLLTTPAAPSTNGLCEHQFFYIKQALRVYLENSRQDQWDRYIPPLTYALNTAFKESIKATPFEIVFGRKPRLFGEVEIHGTSDTRKRKQQLNDLPRIREEAQQAIFKAQEIYTRRYNKTHVAASYQAGDIVLVHNPATPLGLSPKITRHWGGPYYVTSIISPTTLRVTSLKNPLVTKVVNVRRVKSFHKAYETTEDEQIGPTPNPEVECSAAATSSDRHVTDPICTGATISDSSSDLSDSSSTSDPEQSQNQEYITRSGRRCFRPKKYPQ